MKDEDTKNENNSNRIFRFNNFWEKLGTFMTRPTSKIIVIVIYCIYMATAIWNLSKQSTEATLNLSFIYGTYRYSYYEKYKKYYNQYEYRLQIIITQELNYADRNVQENIEGMMQIIENDPLISDSILTESWLRTYLQFLSDRRIKLFLTGFNLKDSKDFLFVLRHFFLRIPSAERFKQDIAFDKNFTKIISTRFLVQTNFTRDDNLFYKQLVQLRKKLDTAPYSVVIYHPFFFCFDFADMAIISAAITLLIVATVIFLITCILLPSIICIVSVLLSISSIVASILGYMVLWSLNINFYAITYLTLSIGFSIDYVVHVSSAYLLSKGVDPNRRLVETITLVGKPILQSSLSTIIAILCAIKIPSKDVRDCLKICILTFATAAIHGILFLPTIISLLDSLYRTIHGNAKKKEMQCISGVVEDIKLQGIVNKTIDDDL